MCFRYFKGDIQIASVDGYGTDVYVYLQSLSHMAQVCRYLSTILYYMMYT